MLSFPSQSGLDTEAETTLLCIYFSRQHQGQAYTAKAAPYVLCTFIMFMHAIYIKYQRKVVIYDELDYTDRKMFSFCFES